MVEQKVRLACISSGGGTDFESIVRAWIEGWIPEVSKVILISTKEGADCMKKARDLDVDCGIVKPDGSDLDQWKLESTFEELGGVDFVFAVGCVYKIPFLGIDCTIPVYNIHPADPLKHGGKGMYGLSVHEHVLMTIIDQIDRGFLDFKTSRFFTYPTVHEVTSQYDQGLTLMSCTVEIPRSLIADISIPKVINTAALENIADQFTSQAKKLQQIVLPYEHQMLPCAVRMAAKKIIDQEDEKGGDKS